MDRPRFNQQSELKIQRKIKALQYNHNEIVNLFMKLMLIFTCILALWLIQKSISFKTSLQVFVYKQYRIKYILWAFNFYTKEQRMISQSICFFLSLLQKSQSMNVMILHGFFSTLVSLNGIHWTKKQG